MIVSLVLKKRCNIEIDKNGKFYINGEKYDTKDIPFVRYRFCDYSQEDIQFIEEMRERFPKSVHLAEIHADRNTVEVLRMIQNHNKIARFVYVDVDDAVVNEGLSNGVKFYLQEISAFHVDRYMIKDNTSMMYPVLADRIKIEMERCTQGKAMAVDIGVCGSPLSFKHSDCEGQACLTALWARKIMADYLDDDDIPIPTASHEKMTCCGCIQYIEVENDLKLKERDKPIKKVNNKSEGDDSSKRTKKLPKSKGITCWNEDL